MRKESKNYGLWQRFGALALAAVLVFGMLPNTGFAAIGSNGTNDADAVTKADPETLTRPQEIYGDNTLNAGKVTVGKSVSNSSVTVDGQTVNLSDPDNFLITISQTAQVMGLSSETSVPVDVVFVIDTSGSMDDNDRAESLVTAANSAIATLMETNEQNRIAVVAFSSEGNYGGGTSGGAAANVLSSLAHYSDDAATNHLQWVNSQGGTTGNNRNYIAGRDAATITVTTGQGWNQQTQTLNVNAFRHGKNGGTNIQAGIVAGAKILTAVQDKTWTNPDTNETVTRIPFLIVISDGQPTFSYDDETWYDPTITGDDAADEQGPGSGAYEGNGFIAALTAAYYKGKITEHYYGDSASADNHCFVYTMGVEIEALDDYENNWGQMVSAVGDNQSLAQITLDPATYAVDGQGYYTYGNTWDSNSYNRNTTNGWRTYWNNYQNGNNFTVRVDNENPTSYTFTADSIAASKAYVDSLAYNDDYFAADDVADMEAIFEALIAEIQKKAITVPTKVTTGDHDFDGYITFTDPLGEYMELKDMKGIIADGYFYQGVSAAQYMASGTNTEFNALLEKVLITRMSMSASAVSGTELLNSAKASSNQAYYNSPTDYDNSIVWWGNEYHTGEEDAQVQVVGAADNDTIEYIEAQKAAGNIPDGADYVCRSYFFYGEAGGANPNPEHEFLYFVVRVQRSIHAPYQQTVVISAPASLLSVEKVMVNETFDDNGDPVYTVSVEEADPARVVYEVGLWDSITAENVSTIVSDTYAAETVNGEGQVNYDPATDTYYFFTNDWDRSQAQNSHHRPMAKATFDAAADNAFYTYQEDTLIVNANGDPVTSNPAGTTAYYVRTYYDWANATQNADGTYTATKKTQLIKVDIPSDANLINEDGKWYIPKGAYTATTLIVNGDDVLKSDNTTNTSEIVAHPHRTGESNNSHYTVFLGNNGVISLVSNPPEPTKTVENLTQNITDADGRTVMVGDELEYKITAKNYSAESGTITITDKVPAGTELVSVANGGVHTDGTITWTLNNVAAGTEVTVSFKVRVTEAALDNAVVSSAIQNTATVKLNDEPSYNTNTTNNPPEGKKVVIQGDPTGTSVQVGDILQYSIEFHNDTGAVATEIKVVDILPDGTTFLSADHNGVYDALAHTVTWTFTNVQPGMGGVVTFTVQVDASAKTPIENGATITIGNNSHTTNTTSTTLDKGSLSIAKVLAQGDAASEAFELTLTDATGMLAGDYTVTGSSLTTKISFTNGVGKIQIKAGETITIADLPAGVELTIVETPDAGWTPTYSSGTVTVPANDTATVTVTNDYYAEPVKFQLQGIKTFSGSNFPTGTFTFRAQEYSMSAGAVVDGGIVVTAVVTSNGEGSVVFSFSERTFAAEIDRYYLITEDSSSIPGVTTDSMEYLLHLVVVDNGEGKMVLTAEISNDGGNSWTALDNDASDDVLSISFINTYEPKETSVTIGGTKTLTGRYLALGEYAFQLVDPVSGNVIAAATNTAGNPYSGTFAFPAITYTAEDLGGALEKTFTYYIREVNAGAANTTYDTDYYEVQVKVRDVGGSLKATYSIYKYEADSLGNYPSTGTLVVADAEDFDVIDTYIGYSNTYNIQDVSVTLTGNKVLTGEAADGITAGEYSFTVYRYDLAAGTKGSVVSVGATGSGAASAAISFAPIGFTAADMTDAVLSGSVYTKDFYFLVEEDIPEGLTKDPNMYYDPAQYLAKVTVTYDPVSGLLSVGTPTYQIWDGTAWTDVAGMTYANIQNLDYVTFAPVGQKTTNGAELPAGLRFSFRVYSLDAQGNHVLEGTGISDPTTAGTTSTNSVVFTTLVITDAEFAAADADNDGVATFTYYIEESNASAHNGVDYDESVYRYEVVVKRDATNKLVVESESYAKLNPTTGAYETIGAVTFTNEYEALAHIELTAGKNLTGGIGLNENAFDFRLQRLDATGKLISGSAINGTNDGSGLVTFATLNYSTEMLQDAYKHADGCWYFSYLMTEIKPATAAIPGVDYDETQYIVTIKLTQTGTDLAAELANVSYASHNAAADTYSPGTSVTGFTAAGSTNVTFVNDYTPTGTNVTIEATKTLTGRALTAGEFGFALYRYNEATQEWLNIGTAFNTADGDISFTRHYNETTLGTMAFGADNTYTVLYRIDEVNNNLGGITYSGDSYYVQVVITHENAAYTVTSVKYFTDEACTEEADEVVFANSYDTNDVHFTPVADKVLLGANNTERNPAGFSFQVVETDAYGNKIVVDAINGIHKVVATGTSDSNGDVNFSSVHYANETLCTADDCTDADCEGKVHSHYYVIEELHGNTTGITYSTENYYVKVDIHDNGKGLLEITGITYYSDKFATEIADTEVLFTNHYGSGSIDLNLEIDKTFKTETGRDYDYKLQGSEFDFEVYSDAACTVLVTSSSNGPSVDGVAPITFGSIVITKDQLVDGTGTFTYYIKEVSRSGAAHIGIDPTVIKVEVTVTDDGYGNLTASYVYTNAATGASLDTFTNVYQPADANVSLEVNKYLEGKDLTEAFTFILSDGTNEIGTWTNLGGGKYKVEWSYDSFDMSGAAYSNGIYTKVFSYKLYEKSGTATNANGEYVYDQTIYNVTVTLTDDGSGALHAAIAVTKANGDPVQTVVFNNQYDPTDVTLNLTAAIDATKTIVDDEGNVLTRDDVVFTFLVKDLNGQTVATGKNQADGTIVFEPNTITYSVPGEYRYQIIEVMVTREGYVMDTNVWCIHVQVRYDSATGKLSVSEDEVYKHLLVDGHAEGGIASQASEDPAFVNVYDAKDVHLKLTLDKSITGDRTAVKENEFLFQLLNADGTIAAEARNDASGKVAFYLDYNLQDLNGQTSRTFTYTVKEKIPSDAVDNGDGTYTLNGVTYDTSTYTVTVVLADDGKGSLTATVNSTVVTGTGTVDTGIDFVNRYTAADVIVPFHAIKRMEGMPLEAGIYTFYLKDGDTILAEGTNKADGTIVFNKELTFTEPGTYTYTMVEYKGAKPGVTFDETSFTVTVVVTDNGKGKLEAKVTYTTTEGQYDLPVFINIYKPTGVSVVIEAQKDLDGRELKEEFTFQLLDSEGKTVSEVKNAADGKVTFESMYFEEVGTHTYTIVEVIPDEAVENADGTYTLNGVTYDQTVYTVVVEITDPGYDGTLDKKVTYYLGTQEVDADKVVFTNTYTTTDSNEIVIEGTKVLENQDLDKEIFEFQLKDSEGHVLQTKTHDEDGLFSFDALKYSFADLEGETTKVFTYTVVEVQGNRGGVTYDKTVYTVKVTVTDNGDGTLTASAAITGGKNDGKIVFTNTYKAEAATTDVIAKKELTGKDLEDDEFSFVLVNQANQDERYTVTNKADGSITFEDLSFSAAGTYVYDLYEVKGDDEQHYDYDDKVIVVTITVVDNGDGTMTATPAYSQTAVFQNTYKPDPLIVILEGSKELTGRDLEDGEFDFEVRDAQGRLVTTGTNKADGTIVFEQIVFETEMDLTLYVTEVKGTDKNIEYDDYTYRVKLVVTNENGVLKADIQYLDGDVVFYNEYEVPVTPPTGDDTPVYVYAGLMGFSAVALMAVLILGRKKKERKHF